MQRRPLTRIELASSDLVEFKDLIESEFDILKVKETDGSELNLNTFARDSEKRKLNVRHRIGLIKD